MKPQATLSGLLALILLPAFTPAIGQDAEKDGGGEVIPLWKDGAPGYEDKKDEPEVDKNGTVSNVHYPTLTAFRPEAGKGNGVAIVIAPGGGLRQLGMRGEGYAMAKLLAEHGCTAFVLKYRLSREPGVPYKFEEEVLQDGQRAMRLARSRAEAFGFDPNKVGMMGFSAGGEVVSIVSYRSGKGNPDAPDPVDRLDAKPSFQILVYPGPMGIPSKLPADAPPAFMLIAADDGHASVLLNLMQRFRESGIDYEAHLYARGGHGFGMGQRSQRVSLQHWTDRLLDWLHDEVLNEFPK
ncbi:MAG: alpha/beta hydrolase [Verrucomicrobiae bacterium]|nr:alpha/beta hydrolase [Verrucomicrobiae bacterium]